MIDPFLRTIGFAGVEGKLLAALHFHASHPRAAYKRNRVSSDVPGVALNYLEEHDAEGFQLYLTGCAGNVAFGKYQLSSKEKSLQVLGRRLGKELAANLKHLEAHSKGGLHSRRRRLNSHLTRSGEGIAQWPRR